MDHAERARREAAARSRLAATREELHQLVTNSDQERLVPTRFPRSKTMRMLTTGRGMALLALLVGGLVAQPRLLKAAFRVIPIGALARSATARFMNHAR